MAPIDLTPSSPELVNGSARINGDFESLPRAAYLELQDGQASNGTPEAKGHVNGHVNSFSTSHSAQPIAVIGLSLRFPQDATTPEKFWQLLLKGRSARTRVPKERYNVEAHYTSETKRPETLHCEYGHFLEQDISSFDAPFFGINPTEAHCMDPQQRLLLETAYEAFENAGLSLDEISGSRTSVYMGSFGKEYDMLLARDPLMETRYKATGTATSMVANRLSWFFNLSGTSITLDTACSSSLTALHLACEDIRAGKSDMALVGGCNLIMTPESSISLGNINCLSPDGISYSFDHRANGYARGEGIGVVVIKSLAKAVQDGNTLRSVIRASGANQDGRTVDIAQPSEQAQMEMINQTYRDAGLDMEPTRYVEAHGTGTPIGDPIEVGSIQRAFGAARSASDPLYVGAVKSNIGHLEATSGLAGLLKAILVLENGVIPGNTWFEKPNPRINNEPGLLKFPTETTQWPTDGLRRASVSSYGFGGANAHVVLDDAYHFLQSHNLTGSHKTKLIANAQTNGHVNGSAHSGVEPLLFTWSGQDESALMRMLKAYKSYVEKASEMSSSASFLKDLAWTLSKRSALSQRASAVAATSEELLEALSGTVKATRSVSAPRLGFVFTGQGAQWYAMGKELKTFPVFKKSLENSQAILKSIGSQWTLLDELEKDKASSRLDNPQFAQSICAALQIALCDLLTSFEIRPTVVVGHSSGEIAAAYCTGAITQVSALRIAFARGLVAEHVRSRSDRDTEAMMAVGISHQDVSSYLNKHFRPNDRIWIGCMNSPKSTTVTGSERCIDDLRAILEKDSVFTRKLKVDVAYHSPSMEEVAGMYEDMIRGIEPGMTGAESQPVFVSTVTGRITSPESLCDSQYWISNLVSPVRFQDAVAIACNKLPKKAAPSNFNIQGRLADFLLEIGPHSALQGPLRECLQSHSIKDINYASVLTRQKSAVDTTLAAIGSLSCTGYAVDSNIVNTRGGVRNHGQLLLDAPSYPFNRDRKYWLESRLSKNLRYSEHPYNDLLGLRDPDWNSLEPKWRSFISLSERPWISDHLVQGTAVYPGTGHLVMAIEAARQLIGPDQAIKGYRFRDTAIGKALVVPASGSIEVNFFLRPNTEGSTRTVKWHHFRLCSLENNEWSENCSGSIAVELHEPQTQDTSETKSINQVKLVDRDDCVVLFGTKQLYHGLRDLGLSYGPSFRLLKDIRADGHGGAVASLDMQEWKQHTSWSSVQSHVIHPASLDATFQAAYAALLGSDKEKMASAVPTLIRNLWVSGSLRDTGLKSKEANATGHSVEVQATAKVTGYRTTMFNISVADVADKTHRLDGEIVCTNIADPSSERSHDSSKDLTCFKIATKPDPDFMSSTELGDYCARFVEYLPYNLEAARLADEVCLLACTKARRLVHPDQITPDQPHLHNFLGWLERQNGIIRSTKTFSDEFIEILEGDNKRLIEVLENKCRQIEAIDDTTCRIVARSARNVDKVLKGETGFLELFFHDNLANEYYRHDVQSTTIFQQLEVLVDMMAHKSCSMKILEIGAGTGSATQHMIRALLEEEGTTGQYLRASEYVFTDIAPSFFEAAKNTFQAHNDQMTFATLDIEKDPTEQGFKPGEFDIILASNVLHATKDLNATLQRARSLLKDGGKLIVHEAVAQGTIMPGFVFGMFPGWWLSVEEERKWSPVLTEPRWNHYLSASGFTGIDTAFRDKTVMEDNSITTNSAIMIATASHSLEKKLAAPMIVVDESSYLQQDTALNLQHLFAARGLKPPEIIVIGASNDFSFHDQTCISLLELGESILHRPQSEKFRIIQSMVSHAKSIIWTEAFGNRSYGPTNACSTGFGRVARSESDGMQFYTLALEDSNDSKIQAEHIFNVFDRVIIDSVERETEFVIQNGNVSIKRMTPTTELNDHLRQHLNGQEPEILPFEQVADRRLKMTVGTPGLLDTLQFVDDDVPESVEPDEIEIAVKASGINFRDILIALGQVDARYLGSECAGVITQVGANFKGDLKVGDRVCSMVEGSLRTHARCHAASACRIPDDMPFAIAASLPIVHATAYQCLYVSARIQPGESILIHSGSGGLGQACIQLAKLTGAEIYATVGTDEKRLFLQDYYQIPAEKIFSSRDLAFKEKILERTNGWGVDVVINSLAGEALRASWELIAPNGRFIEVGKKDIHSLGTLPMYPFAKMATFSSVDLAALFQVSPKVVGDLIGKVLELFNEGRITVPDPLQTFSSEEIAKAFRLMQSGKSKGKLVIELGQKDTVTIAPSTKPLWEFDPNATYVLSGGLGGLGKSMARWMVTRGVKHLLLLSRSGATSEMSTMFLKEMKMKGAKVLAPACDISDRESLRKVLDEVTRELPPIKGCIQGAMVLRDMRFDTMSTEDFAHPAHSKIDGSWNLHTLLPPDLDFFILLASVSGICGTHGQANYAAANTYQDALAAHRIREGKKAQVIDLGNFQSIGHWEYLPDIIAQRVGAHNYRALNEAELHAALEWFCNPSLPMAKPENAQIVMGLELPSSLRAKGIDDLYWMDTPLFSHLYRMGSTSTTAVAGDSTATNIEALITAAKSAEEAADAVVEGLQDKIAKTLDVAKDDIDGSRSMVVYGVDSLAAVEIKTWFKNVVGAEVAVFEILSNASLATTALLAVKRSRFMNAELKDE